MSNLFRYLHAQVMGYPPQSPAVPLTVALSSTAPAYRGLIVLANLVDGHDQGLFDHDFARNLVTDWMRVFGANKKQAMASAGRSPLAPSTQEQLLMDSFGELCVKIPSITLSGGRSSFLLSCVRDTKSKTAIGYATVMETELFINYLIGKKESDHALGKAWVDAARSRVIDVWHTGRPNVKTTVCLKGSKPVMRGTVAAHASVGNPDSVLWVTPGRNISVNKLEKDPGSRIRDRLGLVQRYDCTLVSVRLPPSVVNRQLQGRPTVADGSSNRRHIAKPLKANAIATDPWGRTADLAKVSPKKRVLDGCQERVVEPFLTTNCPPVVVEVLGLCGPQRGLKPQQDDDSVFVDKLCAKHGGVAGLLKKVRNLVR